MSERDDDLFARWSRRKVAARRLEARSAAEAAAADSAPAAEPDADLTVPAAPAAEPPEPLPSLEDVTADGDLAAFMRKGVPAALKNAAMRKMWSLDPAIRDHVGLSENAWDFNQPGAMPGFGPLEAGKSVADFLSTTGGATPTDSEEPAPEGPAPVPERPTAVAQEQASDLPPDESAQPPALPEAPRQPPVEVAVTSGSAEAAERAESTPPPGPRNGRRLPR